jgi:CRISPR type III-B/RAMP module RAMP protein Cmr1
MKTETFHLELITPCFCGGAEPDKQAEIRAPSIRGQLRWWFRTLGGFKSLAPMPVREQEALIFGSIAGNEGRAGKLIVRVKNGPEPSRDTRDDREFHAEVGTDRGYLAFPLRSKRKRENGVEQLKEYKGRAVFDREEHQKRNGPITVFDLDLVWRGNDMLWPDIMALLTVFGNLGALGFRSRRALGALAFPVRSSAKDLTSALALFGRQHDNKEEWQSRIRLCEVIARPPNQSYKNTSADDCIVTLAQWLKDWRAHGRTVDHATAHPPNPPHNSGFSYAKNDHDRGVDVGASKGSPGHKTYRAALGLPIIQFFSSGKPQVDWNEKWDTGKARGNRNYKGEGRFASPVLLRPHKDAQGNWHALVIFVDAHKWPGGTTVHLACQGRHEERAVSLELYDKMKADQRLKTFP